MMLFAKDLAGSLGVEPDKIPCIVSFEASDVYNSCLQRLTCEELLSGTSFNANLDDDNLSWECYISLGVVDVNWTREQGYILDFKAANVTIEKPSAAHAAAFIYG